MNLIFSKEEKGISHKHSGGTIFLAGPTRRNSSYEKSWRKEAVDILEELGYKGCVAIPEERDGTIPFDDSPEGLKIQHDWEWFELSDAEVIVFWIPRNIEDEMPAFTTNVEFGYWMGRDPSKVILGYPKDAQRMSYLEDMYNTYQEDIERKSFHSLKETLEFAVTLQYRNLRDRVGDHEAENYKPDKLLNLKDLDHSEEDEEGIEEAVY